MKISSNQARKLVADIEEKFEQGRIRKEEEWKYRTALRHSKIRWWDEADWTTPGGYDDSPDQGVHQFDGGGTFF